MYIGSTTASIGQLEYRHRNARKLYGVQGMTCFRKGLENEIKSGQFQIIHTSYCIQQTIEELEGTLIRLCKPPYNKDLDPVKSSKKYGRYC